MGKNSLGQNTCREKTEVRQKCVRFGFFNQCGRLENKKTQTIEMK